MASIVTIAVHVRSQAAAGIRSVRTAVAGLISSITSSLGSIGQSVTQSIGSAMSQGMSNPYVAAGVAALVAAVAPAIGALLAAGITLAFGGAFIGLGAFLLKDNEKVKSAWGKTIGDLKKKFTDAAKPLIPVLTHAAELVGKLGDKFAPHFKKAMEAAAPHLNKFLDKIASGIEKFGKKAFEPMMTAFNDLLDNIDVDSFFSSLGDAFAYLGKTVSKNKREIGLLINIILGILPVAIRVIGWLTEQWGNNVRNIQKVIQIIQKLIGWISKIAGKTIKFSQKGAGAVVDWVKRMIKWVKDLKGKVISLGQRGASNVIGWVKKVRDWISGFKGKTVTIAQRGAGAVVSAVRSAIRWVSSLKGKTISLAQKGAGAVVSAAKSVISWVRRIVGKTISIGINVVAKGATKLLDKINPFAKGGVVGAAGGGPRSNLAMVGENGPELVRLPFGSTVKTNADTRRALAGGGRGGMQPFVLQVVLGDKTMDFVIDPLRKSIQKRGGVQAALGKL